MFRSLQIFGAVTRIQIAWDPSEECQGVGRFCMFVESRMEDRRRGRGAAPRDRAEDPTLALLRQQQETMVRMMEQQQRTNAVIELLAARFVQGPDAGGPLPVAPPVVRPPPPPPTLEPPVQPPPVQPPPVQHTPVQPPPVQPPPVQPPPCQPPPAHPPPARDEMSEWRRVALAMAASSSRASRRHPTFANSETENPAHFLEEVSGQMGEVPQG
jgi:hypothetical protein